MTEDAATSSHLVLEGALTVRTAEAICGELAAAITQSATISIDCSAATEVDISFIQLLVAARLSARPMDKDIVLANPPDGALLNTLTRAGFRTITVQPATGASPAFWFEGAAA